MLHRIKFKNWHRRWSILKKETLIYLINNYYLNRLHTNRLSQDAQGRWREILSLIQVLIGGAHRIAGNPAGIVKYYTSTKNVEHDIPTKLRLLH